MFRNINVSKYNYSYFNGKHSTTHNTSSPKWGAIPKNCAHCIRKFGQMEEKILVFYSTVILHCKVRAQKAWEFGLFPLCSPYSNEWTVGSKAGDWFLKRKLCICKSALNKIHTPLHSSFSTCQISTSPLRNLRTCAGFLQRNKV